MCKVKKKIAHGSISFRLNFIFLCSRKCWKCAGRDHRTDSCPEGRGKKTIRPRFFFHSAAIPRPATPGYVFYSPILYHLCVKCFYLTAEIPSAILFLCLTKSVYYKNSKYRIFYLWILIFEFWVRQLNSVSILLQKDQLCQLREYFLFVYF